LGNFIFPKNEGKKNQPLLHIGFGWDSHVLMMIIVVVNVDVIGCEVQACTTLMQHETKLGLGNMLGE